MGKERTLKEYLNALPKQVLMKLCGGEGGGIVSVSGLINDVLKRYGAPGFLHQFVNGLDEDDRALLRLVLFEGKNGADALFIADRFKKLKDEERNDRLSSLQNRFLLYGVKSTPFRYMVFGDLRPALEAVALEQGAAEIRKCHVGKETRTCGDGLFRDMALFLLFLATDSIRKTKNGQMNRKQVNRLFQAFENRMEPGDPESGELPSLFRIIHGYAVKRELIEEDAEKLALSPKGMKWLDEAARDQAADWYRYILREYKEEKARLALTLLKKAGGPLHGGDMASFFFSKSASDPRPMPEIFEWLFHSGLIDSVNGAHGNGGFILSARGEEVLKEGGIAMETASQVTVLPTFEMLVPRMLETRLSKRLFAVAGLEKSDALHTFKISRESLYNGLNRGMKASEAMAFLEKVSQHSLPQNVHYSLQEWLDAHGAVSFESHFLLRVKKPETYQKVKAILSGSSYGFEELPPMGFSISFADYNNVFSILSKLGFAPRPFAPAQPRNGAEKGKTILESYERLFPAQGGETEEELLLPDEAELPADNVQRENGKYGGKFKKLPYHELVHVLNYSILMEQKIEAELKDGAGRVLMVPAELALQTTDPMVKGHDARTGEKTEIKINDIEKIRVEG